MYLPKRNENIGLYNNLYIHIHSSIIYSSQKMEATQLPPNGWVKEKRVVFPYIAIFGNKKEWVTAVWYN